MSVLDSTAYLECKYCKIDLTNVEATGLGFVNCPSCLRSFLKMPRVSSDFNVASSEPRQQVLSLFVEQQKRADSIEGLQQKLKEYAEVLTVLEMQKESLVSENGASVALLNEQLFKAQQQLEVQTKEHQQLLEKIDNSGLEIDRLLDLINAKNQFNMQMEKELAIVSERLSLRDVFCETIEKESAQKTIALANTNKDISDLKMIIDEYEGKLKILSDELNVEKTRAENLSLSLQIIPDLEFELDKTKLILHELEQASHVSKNANIFEINEEQISLLNNEISELKVDIKNYMQTISELQAQLALQEYEKLNRETGSILLQDADFVLKHEENDFVSPTEQGELVQVGDDVKRLEQLELKNEQIQMELEISRDELYKAQKEIEALNMLLKNSMETLVVEGKHDISAPSENDQHVLVASEIERREEELIQYAYDINSKIDDFLNQMVGCKVLAYDLAVMREDGNGRTVDTIFAKDTVLPVGDMELRKTLQYKTILNKGKISYQQDVSCNLLLNKFFIDFSSNISFFLNEADFNILQTHDDETEIREEYVLNASGELSVVFYRNNGFKKFENKIGKLLVCPVKNIQKVQV